MVNKKINDNMKNTLQYAATLIKNNADTKCTSIYEVEISELHDNPFKPRMEMEPEPLIELASSIKQQGLLQPIVIAKNGNTLTIIAGHRRVKAHRLLQKRFINAIIKEDTVDVQLAMLPLVENLQRVSIRPIENAIAYNHILKEKIVKTKLELADLLGISESHLTKKLSVLRLPDDLLETIKADRFNDITVISALNKVAKKDLHSVYAKVKTLSRREAIFFIKSLSFY